MTEEPKNQLPEAPASASVKIKSPNGFEYIFTMRDEKASELIKKMEALENTYFIPKGYTALAQNNSKFPPKKEKEYIEGRVCPTDGGRLVKPAEGSKAPIKCENNKWNPTTKKAYGCEFIEWQNNKNNAPEIPERDVDASDY